MLDFLRAAGLMAGARRTYLDVGCSYGWFVAEMSRAGFLSEGVESDPTALAVGQLKYGLSPEQLHRSDAITFLRSNRTEFEVTSCFSLTHHYLLKRRNATAEELLQLLDRATRRVLFFDMGQEHEREFWGDRLRGWNPDSIHRWLEANSSFSQIVRLGEDTDAVPPFQTCYGRTMFACAR
jgi:SAM-dependent methyltransferase